MRYRVEEGLQLQGDFFDALFVRVFSVRLGLDKNGIAAGFVPAQGLGYMGAQGGRNDRITHHQVILFEDLDARARRHVAGAQQHRHGYAVIPGAVVVFANI
ncbi:hypothetical protein D3C80_1919970 [compost metagenome]